MSIDHRYEVDSRQGRATIVTRSARIALNPRHRLVTNISHNIDLLHKVVMGAHSGHLVEGADRVRERLKILYVAQRSQPGRMANGLIRTLLVQSQTQANWSELTSVGAATLETDRQVRYTIADGDVLHIRIWANPTKVTDTARDRRGKSKRVPIYDHVEASYWIDRVMWNNGFDIDTRKLRVGDPRTVGGPRGLTITLWPYQFRGVVKDAKLMAEAIVGGVGRGKAYGAGLLHIQNV